MIRKVMKKEEILFKDLKLYVDLFYYFDDINNKYFLDQELENENNRSIINEYKKRLGLLTDIGIKKIRSKYNLCQKEFSIILGLNESDIEKYEAYEIQDKNINEIIIKASNPDDLLSFAKANKDLYLKHYNEELYNSLIIRINNIINDNPIFSGYNKYNEIKLLEIINMLSKRINNLNLIKLKVLLFYIDFISYKEINSSITGLKYIHDFNGISPLNFDEILRMNIIPIKEKYYEESDCYDYYIGKLNIIYSFNDNEVNIIDKVINRFINFNTKQMVDYIKSEYAYKDTRRNEIIKYNYAKYMNLWDGKGER